MAQEKVRVDSHVAVKMRDGVTLYADIYRPAREGKFPVIVIRTPYGVQREGVVFGGGADIQQCGGGRSLELQAVGDLEGRHGVAAGTGQVEGLRG